jgi:predicted nucleotidyltransferase
MRANRLRYLTSNEQSALDEFVRRLRAKYADQVLLVRLFGSKARGDFDAESDVDVLVVVKNNDWQFSDDVALEACDPMLEHNVVISPTVVGADHYGWLQEHKAPFYRAVKQDGVDLWTKTPVSLSVSA